MTQLPPLTILEEFLLLSLDERSGSFHYISPSNLNAATAGAVMMDLMLRRRLDTDLRNIFVVDNTTTGDDMLDPILQLMAVAPVLTPRPIQLWLDQLAEQGEGLRDRSMARLEARGILTRDGDGYQFALGERRYPAEEKDAIREVKWRIFELILGDDIPSCHDIMLTALADGCGLFHALLSGPELTQAATRIAKVARLDLIGQAVARSMDAPPQYEGLSAMAAASAFG